MKINKENEPDKENEKDADAISGQKPEKEKSPRTSSDNDNGFVSPATEDSSNKGQGPAGEDL